MRATGYPSKKLQRYCVGVLPQRALILRTILYEERGLLPSLMHSRKRPSFRPPRMIHQRMRRRCRRPNRDRSFLPILCKSHSNAHFLSSFLCIFPVSLLRTAFSGGVCRIARDGHYLHLRQCNRLVKHLRSAGDREGMPGPLPEGGGSCRATRFGRVLPSRSLRR